MIQLIIWRGADDMWHWRVENIEQLPARPICGACAKPGERETPPGAEIDFCIRCTNETRGRLISPFRVRTVEIRGGCDPDGDVAFTDAIAAYRAVYGA